MEKEGTGMLLEENIPKQKIELVYSLDLRYVKQYHEVNIKITRDEIDDCRFDRIASKFHPEHNRLYGYSLEDQGTSVELINLRLTCIGRTDKPKFVNENRRSSSVSHAFKNKRKIYIPGKRDFVDAEVYDGDKLRYGNEIRGPAIVEQVNTTTFIGINYDMICDRFGSYTLYVKGKGTEIKRRILK
jgi:N-methylhydantoinase A